MSERQAPLIGVLLGLVLLGAVAAFAVALPKATGDETTDAGEVTLPDTLPHGLVAEDQTEGVDVEQYAAIQESASDGLEDLYDAPAVVRAYATEDRAVQATVTVLDRAPGLFDPQGPPVDPSLQGFERSFYELRGVGDAVCNLIWGEPVPEGQPVDESADPRAVMCQLGDGDRTFEFLGSGLSAEAAVEVLESVASGT
jgi:hypothetical protein